MKAQDYRDEAKKHLIAKEESFERCDTDGFLSQWASGLSAQLAERKAEITENGNLASFIGLYEGDRRVKAKMGFGKFGSYWLLHEDEKDLISQRGKPFLPTGSSSRVLKALGLAERSEMAPAWARFEGKGKGLGGSCWVATFRTGDPWGQDSIIDD